MVSSDVINWTKVTTSAVFSGRNQRVVNFNDGGDAKLWKIGRSSGADTWSSKDGVTWTKETSNFPSTPNHSSDKLVSFNNGDGEELWSIGFEFKNNKTHAMKSFNDRH